MTGALVLLGRAGARAAAENELDKPIYHRHDPPWWQRLLMPIGHWLGRAVEVVASHGAVSGVAVAVLLGVATALVLVARRRLGRPNVAGRRDDRWLGGRPLTAAEHRAEAERHAARDDWAAAVRERFRAVVAECGERGLVDVRPGLTPRELAGRLAAAHPGVAVDALDGARRFESVQYGGRPATADDYRALADLDGRVRDSRARVA